MYKKKKTKIVTTIGPATNTAAKMEELLKHGANVFRFNMKHGTVEEHHKNIETAQKVADKLKIPVGILIDLQGPEIRIQTRDGEEINLKKGAIIKFGRKFYDDETLVRIPHTSVFDALKEKSKFLIDDGFVQMEVVEVGDQRFKAKIAEDGIIKNNKSLNLFGIDIKLPSLIKDDIDRLTIADSKKVDYVALSFARSKKDLDVLRDHMKKQGITAQVVAKVESQAAIDNIDELIEHSDVIMIARGDLGVETPIEKLAYYQKMIINKCRHASTPVIVATQMLESMIVNPIPTRAEATDVANAVLDGADALMLSGETAMGKHPIKAVAAMSRIAMYNEAKIELVQFKQKPQNATELIVEAAETIAEDSGEGEIDHIVVMTETGYTAKVLSTYRPKIPVIAITESDKTVETLTMSYGIKPIKVDLPDGTLLSPEFITKLLVKEKVLSKGEQILLIHGQHWKEPGQTNAIVLVTV